MVGFDVWSKKCMYEILPSKMLIPFVFPEIVFTSILVNVGPLNVELVEDRRNWIRIERSRVAVERTQRTVAHSRPQAVDSPTAVNWKMLKKN